MNTMNGVNGVNGVNNVVFYPLATIHKTPVNVVYLRFKRISPKSGVIIYLCKNNAADVK